MEHGMLRQNDTVGQNGRGKTAPFRFTPKVVTFFPNALVRLPHAHYTYENSDESVQTVLGQGR